jgi:hypothetical protein
MDELSSGFTVLFNGGYASLAAAANWSAVFGVLTILSLVWMARLELDDVERRGAKPPVQRH